jgi:hypothetical protein
VHIPVRRSSAADMAESTPERQVLLASFERSDLRSSDVVLIVPLEHPETRNIKSAVAQQAAHLRCIVTV